MSSAAAKTLRERIRGKWQIPALFVSVALLVGAIQRLRSVQVFYPFEAYLAQLVARVEDGQYAAAVDYGGRLQARKDITAADRAAIHLQLARAHFGWAQRENRLTPEAAETVIAEYAAAFPDRAARESEDLMRWGEAHAWRRELAEALRRYEQAIDAAAQPALAVRRRVIELCRDELNKPADELIATLDRFIEDASGELDALFWAVGAKVDLLSADGWLAEAAAALQSVRGIFEPSPLCNDYRFLVALVKFRSGEYDQVENELRSMRNTLALSDELYAKTGWLLGRVVLFDGELQRPEEALSFFRDVITTCPASEYVTASRLGMAECCAALGRHEESLEQFRQVVEVIPRSGPRGRPLPLLDADAVRASITVVGERLRREGLLDPALQYYELAWTLLSTADHARQAQYLEILGDVRTGLARSLRERAGAAAGEEQRARLESDARYLLIEAGESYLKLAQLDLLNEAQAADAVWRAASLFEDGSASRRTIETLERFRVERPDNDRIPQALLRLGQARQSLGLYQEAIDAYEENLRRFPTTPDAGGGLIPMARCYMAMGPGYGDQAVETLKRILDDSAVFTPQAPEFREAMFLLGDLHHRQGRFEDAISVLEEAVERYPADERGVRAGFVLADAYRHSALALKRESEDPAAASDRPRMRRESAERFTRAAALFAEWIDGPGRELEQASAGEELPLLFSKHARLYQADCLFELGWFAEAVPLYETAAFIHRDDPSALSAYVQVINCRLSMGQSAEARTAMRRAKYLLQTMPETAFQGVIAGQSRREWERYMDWLEGAELFQG